MKLSYKIFFGIFLTVLAAVLIGYGIFRFEAGRRFHKSLVLRLQQTGAVVDYQLAPLISSGDFINLNKTVVKLGQLSGARITIIKNDGKVLADSKENPDEMENHAKRPEVVKAIAGKVGSSVRYSSTLRKNMLYVALPAEKSGGISYVVRISMFSQDVNKLLSSLTKVMIIPTMVLLLFAAIISILIARTVSTPIKRLMIASRAVSQGEFSHKVNITGCDEVGELALHFNEMTEHLSDYVLEISSQKDTLNAVVNNISEGIIALEIDGRVQLFNKAVIKLLGVEFVLGKFYWEMVREPEISKIKKDFVTNASHELKTPLTSINGFLDLAMEGCDCETNKYLEVVKRNTQRLINIVNDLLTLAELEKKGLKFDSREININSLIQNITAFLEIKAKEKNLYLKIKLPEEDIFIKGDEFKIEQLLVNLIDNAIKYTESGGVTVTLKSKNGKAIISVADTGIGIAEKDISRIFERFYVSDKARSRKSGGTGLGLSIVKHIVMIHDGKISVKSKPDKGTEFIVVL